MVRRAASEHRGDSLLAEFCEMQCWVNSVREAIATAREIVSGYVRSGELTDNAEFQARDGDVTKAEQAIVTAIEATETMSDSSERALAFTEVAEAARRSSTANPVRGGGQYPARQTRQPKPTLRPTDTCRTEPSSQP